jgi:excisionase family DNA binding protein
VTPVKPGRAGRVRWLTLGEAAQFLGVDVTTLRGWADAEKVRVFRTPGGHRRFDLADLDALIHENALPSTTAALPAAPPGGPSASRQWLTARPWYEGISEASRARVRGYCAELMRIVASYSAGRPARPRHLAAARRVGAALGRTVAAWGITPAQSTEVFLYFKMHVTEALAQSRQGGGDRVQSMRDADAFFASVLQSMMDAYGASRGRMPSGARGSRT